MPIATMNWNNWYIAFVKCMRLVFEYNSWNVVGAVGFVVGNLMEIFIEECECDVVYYSFFFVIPGGDDV